MKTVRVPRPRTLRDLPGWPGYGADGRGDVWSCRTNSGKLLRDWRKLKVQVNRGSEVRWVRLRDGVVGHNIRADVVVLTAFVGPQPDGMAPVHKDGDPANCRPDNLEWGVSEAKPRTKAPAPAVTEADARIMARLTSKGWPASRIAAKYGMQAADVDAILAASQGTP